jgi:hypothetical protein
VDLVLDDIAIVEATFGVALVKFAFVSADTLTIAIATVQIICFFRLRQLIKTVEMRPTLFANVLTGHGGYTGPSINNEELGVLMRSHIHLGVEVFQVGRVSLQRY